MRWLQFNPENDAPGKNRYGHVEETPGKNSAARAAIPFPPMRLIPATKPLVLPPLPHRHTRQAFDANLGLEGAIPSGLLRR